MSVLSFDVPLGGGDEECVVVAQETIDLINLLQRQLRDLNDDMINLRKRQLRALESDLRNQQARTSTILS